MNPFSNISIAGKHATSGILRAIGTRRPFGVISGSMGYGIENGGRVGP